MPQWIYKLNPFRSYFEYKIRLLEAQDRSKAVERMERQEEKAAFITALDAITRVSVEAAKASQEQAKALSTFLNSFQTVDAPRVREWDEDQADKRYIESHLPAEMQGLDKYGQFSLLIDKLNGDIE